MLLYLFRSSSVDAQVLQEGGVLIAQFLVNVRIAVQHCTVGPVAVDPVSHLEVVVVATALGLKMKK